MADILKLASKVKTYVCAADEECTDGPLFRLHCKVTSAMLFLAAVAISSKETLGKPMLCITDGLKNDRVQEKVVETFCWTNSTFISYTEEGYAAERRVYHAYYQWVVYVLILQAFFFYLPKVLWNQWEGQLMKNLRDSSNVGGLMRMEARMIRKKQLVDYFITRLQCHRGYTGVYWFCEFLCLVNVVAQVFAMDTFLNGDCRFLTYGLYAFRSTEFRGDIADGIFNFPGQTTMDVIFPMRTRCVFPKYGPSGSVQLLDALCFLEINSFNRYIFLVMWYWFLMLIVLLVSLLLYRTALIFSVRLRNALLQVPGRGHSDYVKNFIAHRLSVTDWWVLNSLQDNIPSFYFGDLVLELFLRLSSPNQRRVKRIFRNGVLSDVKDA